MTSMDVLLIGGGPAACGPLINAFQSGRGALLESMRWGLVEPTRQLAVGKLNRYAIRSNSFATSFIECVESPAAEHWLKMLQHTASYRWLKRHRHEVVPLPIVARFQKQLGIALQKRLCVISKFQPFYSHRMLAADYNGKHWEVELSCGQTKATVRTRQLILALGGIPRPLAEAGHYSPPIAATDVFLPYKPDHDQIDHAVIIGSSHSAWAAAWKLLSRPSPSKSVVILGRSTPKPYFSSIDEATKQGFSDYSDGDVCPKTKRLFRLAGLRGDARNLLLNGHDRLKWHQVSNPHQFAAQNYQNHTLINATGFSSRLPPLSEGGRAFEIASPRAVDEDCRLLDHNAVPVPGVLAIGLGLGYRLPRTMGGEPSFNGQTNGLWLYQNDVGARLLNQLERNL